MKPDLEKLVDQAVFLTGSEREGFIRNRCRALPRRQCFHASENFLPCTCQFFLRFPHVERGFPAPFDFGLGGLTP
jgi:hypothetical protein